MRPAMKTLGRHRRIIRWTSRSLKQPEGLWLFYGNPLPSIFLESLFLCYGSRGFRWALFGASWRCRFWPKHPAYRFLNTGAFSGLYWPCETLLVEAMAQFPAVGQPHFFLNRGFFLSDFDSFREMPPQSVATGLLAGSLTCVFVSLLDVFHGVAEALVYQLTHASTSLTN